MNIFPNLGVVVFFDSLHTLTEGSVDLDQMQVWHLIWVCTVCLRRPTKDVGITDFSLSIILAHKFNDVTAEEFT